MRCLPEDLDEFKALVWGFYSQHGRRMPWRDNTDPYWVLVSEVMLQQTQVRRVEPKFTEFITAFASIDHLAQASLGDVLRLWSGLGYNRRAKFLWQAAQAVHLSHDDVLPTTVEALDALPGIGYNTAAAIAAYAYNAPVVFVETNIRTVFLYHFFPDETNVDDASIKVVVEQALDVENPREWYWALMDYGSHLKSTQGGRLDQSAHHKKQPKLAGSLREMRGRILRVLTQHASLPDGELRRMVEQDERYEPALSSLIKEGMISIDMNTLYLTGAPRLTIIGGHQ